MHITKTIFSRGKYHNGVHQRVKIIVGLGNPGDQYKLTRHNIGFIVTGELASKHNINGRFEAKFNAIIGKGLINCHEVIIIQPQTFMNLSGESLSKIIHFYKLDPKDLIVVFDDLSIDLGRIRFRPSGSDGGHNGIKSIINCLGGYKDFPRLKVGIGPQPKGMPSEAFVLQKFSKTEKDVLDKVTPACIEAIEFALDKGVENARNKFNGLNLAE